MSRRVRWLLPLLLPLAALGAASRDAALLARALIGPEVPTRLLRLENRDPANRRYPREFYGLVITLGDIEWLYTEYDGTQNLSTYRGEIAADTNTLARLLRGVAPGLGSFHEETVGPRDSGRALPALPNGCFPACLARWRQLQHEAGPPRHGRLLACFAPDEPRGHMLLEFSRGGRRWVFDPDRPGKLIRVPAHVADDPLAVAAAALASRWPAAPVRAVPVELPAWRIDPRVAASERRAAPAG